MINDRIRNETNIIDWKTKKSSKKRISIIIYDILTDYKISEDEINELVPKIVELAERNLGN